MQFHAAIWIDHRMAQIYGLSRDAGTRTYIKSHAARHIHHKAGSIGSGHPHDPPEYFRQIAAAIGDAREILILGPGQTKIELKTFLDSHNPAVAERVLAVEPFDHESEDEIIAFARKFFAHADRMTPQR